jgi:succinate-semialdehyde dehydrogenase/glutarate-semialdehyde dehydrogenase
MITLEMGKPIKESRAEISKCALVSDYYAENSEAFLAKEVISSDASNSFVQHTAIESVLAIMPWNIPFWQGLRYAVRTLTAGNVGLLKHVTNVLVVVNNLYNLSELKRVIQKVFFKI